MNSKNGRLENQNLQKRHRLDGRCPTLFSSLSSTPAVLWTCQAWDVPPRDTHRCTLFIQGSAKEPPSQSLSWHPHIIIPVSHLLFPFLVSAHDPDTVQHTTCLFILLSSVQPLSRVWLFATPWTATHQASLSITNSQSLPKPMSIESVTPSNHLILCRPLLLPPSTFPSIKVFSSESALRIRWPKYWEFQLQDQSFQWTPRTDFL